MLWLFIMEKRECVNMEIILGTLIGWILFYLVLFINEAIAKFRKGKQENT